MFKLSMKDGFAITDDQIINQLYRGDVVATEGMVEALRAFWKKLRDVVLWLIESVQRIWSRFVNRASVLNTGVDKTRQVLLQVEPGQFAEFLKTPIHPSTEAFNPDQRTVAIPKDTMVKILKDYQKAAAYIEKYSKTVREKVKALNISSRAKSAQNPGEITALQNELKEIMKPRTEVVQLISTDLQAKCPNLQVIDRGDRLDIISSTPPEMNNACTYAEIGYRTEEDVKECLDLFTTILLQGYRKSTTPYDFVKEFETMRHDLEGVSLNQNNTMGQQLAALMSDVINWIRLLESISLRIDKNQMDEINTGYNFIKNSVVSFSSWNWRK